MSAAASLAGPLLDGLRVLDFSVWRPGPYATQLLAEIGADVIKVEPPGGDPMRMYPELFTSLNANKRSIVVDLKQPAARERVFELAADADVVIEGFRPGVAARLGIDYESIQIARASIIYCSISGMGQDGPLALAAGHDLNYQAWAGALSPEGEAPVVPALPVADLAGGLTAAFAICAAVASRDRTGEGEYIDVAMADILATWTGAAQPKARDADPSARGVPGYGTFETADQGHVVLGVLTEDHFWRPMCDVLDLADVGDLPFAARMTRLTDLQQRIAAAIKRRDRDHLVADLLAAGVPASPVLSRSEMLGLPHFRQRQVVTADPWADPATGYPIRFRHHPAARTSPPPGLDEHHPAGFASRPGDAPDVARAAQHCDHYGAVMATITTPGGVKIAYETAGSGPALVLIHGITESRRAWDPLLPALAADHTVVLVDLPGHGGSGPEITYEVQALADDVAHAVGSLGLGDPVVVGHSLGGIVATAYAAACPTRGIVNIDQPLALADFQGTLRQLEPALRDEASFSSTIDAVLDSMAGPLSMAERQRLRSLRRPDQEVVLAIWAPILESDPEALDSLVRAVGRQVGVPYLAVHGNDPGEAYGDWLSAVIPGAVMEVWRGAGHYPHLVHPDRFLDRLGDFERGLG